MTGFYDMHCHIIPGVDDGADNMETAVQLIQMEYQDGVRSVYVTPHYRRKMFETPMEKILAQFQKLKKEISLAGLDIEMYLGCEFHANMSMEDMLDAGERPTMGGSRCVLTEFSGSSEFKFIQERCYALLSRGYDPVIAHAERYSALYKKFDNLEQLIDMGAYIQMNVSSITGEDGFGMKRFCKKVMKMDMLHFVGTDAHNLSGRKPQMGKCAHYMEKVMGEEYTRKILIDNPRNIVEESR